MPWRLIIFIIIFGIFLVFITFNLENKCDISFGIVSIKEVPVFVTVFSSFAMGLLCALPLVMHIKKKDTRTPFYKKKQKADSYAPENNSDSEAGDNAGKDAAPEREGFFSGRKNNNNE